jgi:hypothetical protein
VQRTLMYPMAYMKSSVWMPGNMLLWAVASSPQQPSTRDAEIAKHALDTLWLPRS